MEIKLFKFKYPKITILVIMILLAYVLFKNPSISDFFSHFENLNYLGAFIGGIFFAFGFTAPLSVGLFLSLNPQNLLIASIFGGLGALISDLFIFKFIKISFADEFKKLKKTKTIKRLEKVINDSLGEKIKIYLMYIFAGILIASPLPDEFGIIMLAGLTKINFKILIVLSFILNTLGILLILIL